MSDESATPGRDSSERRVAAARQFGATRPTSGTSTVGQVSRSRGDSGRRVDSSYTRPKSNVTRASEAATSRTNSDASWTWLIYANRHAAVPTRRACHTAAESPSKSVRAHAASQSAPAAARGRAEQPRHMPPTSQGTLTRHPATPSCPAPQGGEWPSSDPSRPSRPEGLARLPCAVQSPGKWQ